MAGGCDADGVAGGVVGAATGEELVAGQFVALALQPRLKFALGVVGPGVTLEHGGVVADQVVVDLLHGGQAAIEPGGAEEGFKGGGQGAGLLVERFTAGTGAEQEVAAEIDGAGQAGE